MLPPPRPTWVRSIGTRTLSSSSCCVMIGMESAMFRLVLSARP
jgi:hypothetical protein